MIVITGAAGFIGSCLLGGFNQRGISDLMIVDEFSRPDKIKNYEGKRFSLKMERADFPGWFAEQAKDISFVFHIGARTDTTETNRSVFDELNLNYSKRLWNTCAKNKIPLIYASSAATYGNGELGFKDSHDLIPKLQPLNLYGESKNDFDKWALQQEQQPPFWAGLKFFNVYGPNEYHKGRMASVIFHAYHQIRQTGKVKLFKSHRPDYEDGKQLRDFVYVKDVLNVCGFLYDNQPAPGIYNVGSGQARAFLDLALATFDACDAEPNIEYIDMPLDIRENYQYFTEAEMDKLTAAGYREPFQSLEEGIRDYVRNYLTPGRYF